MQIIDKTFL